MSSDFIFSGPQDQGASTQRVDGTKWNYIISKLRRTIPATAVIYKDASTIYSYKTSDGGTITSGSELGTVVNSTTSLYTGRILVKGQTGAASYDVDTPIVPKNNIWLDGEGWAATRLAGTTTLGTAAIIKELARTSSNPVTNFGLSNMEIDGTNMDHASAYSTLRKAVNIAYLRRPMFYGLYIHDTPASGLGIDFIDGGFIDRCYIENCGTAGQTSGSNGFGIGTGGYATEPCLITNSIARNNTNGNFHYEIVGVINPKFDSISNCFAEGGRFGFRITGSAAVNFSNLSSKGASVADYFLNTTAGLTTDINLSNCQSHSSLGDGLQTTHQGIVRLNVDNMIITSAAGFGMNLLNNNATIKGGQIIGCGKTGVYVEPTSGTTRSDFILSDMTVKNNGSLATAGQNDGIRFRATYVTLQGINIHDCICTDDQGSKTQRYGIVLGAGALTDVKVHDNMLQGNLTGGLLDTIGTATNVQIYDNDGYNPVGLSAITVGASPYTYTAGRSYETVYLYGGTVSSITKAGTQIANATGLSVGMEPNTAIIVTYSSLPTMVKNIH